MPSLISNVTKMVSALSLALTMLVAVAPTAQAANTDPTNASIDVTRWLVGTTSAATITWTAPVAETTTSLVMQSPYPWPAAFATNETVTGVTPVVSGAGLVITCIDPSANLNVVFTIDTATVTSGTVDCRFKNTGETNVSQNNGQFKGVWIPSGLEIARGTRISVAVASGLVTAPLVARVDWWVVGKYRSNGWNGTEQVYATTAAYSPDDPRATSKVGFDPTTDTEPTGPVRLEINKELTEATCTVPSYTIPPERYVVEFTSQGRTVGQTVDLPKVLSVKTTIPVWVIGSTLVCNVSAYALHSMFSSSAEELLERPAPSSAPQNVRATAIPYGVWLQWDAAVANSPFPVTNYLAEAQPGGMQCMTNTTYGSLTSCTIYGDAGTEYSFSVQGLSGFSWGEKSAAVTATPYRIAITKVERKKALFGLAQQIKVSGWAPGLKNGTTITIKYRIGNEAMKTKQVFVTRPTGAKDSDTKGRFTFSLKVTGKQRSLPAYVQAFYTNDVLLVPDSPYATSATFRTRELEIAPAK